jgi:hypothetical protein
MEQNQAMDVKSEESVGVHSDVAQPSSAEPGPVSAADAPTPANISDKPQDVGEHHTEAVSTWDVTHVPFKNEEGQGDPKASVSDANGDPIDEATKPIADYISELQSTLNASAAEPSGGEITQNVLPTDLAGTVEGEEESVVGSLDVRLPSIGRHQRKMLTRAGRLE